MTSAELIETAIGLLVIAQKATIEGREPRAADLKTFSDALSSVENELAGAITEHRGGGQ